LTVIINELTHQSTHYHRHHHRQQYIIKQKEKAYCPLETRNKPLSYGARHTSVFWTV